MKYTHRQVGAKKGSMFAPIVKIKAPPKKRRRPYVHNYGHTNVFAKVGDICQTVIQSIRG